jgi:hypothetical protein
MNRRRIVGPNPHQLVIDWTTPTEQAVPTKFADLPTLPTSENSPELASPSVSTDEKPKGSHAKRPGSFSSRIVARLPVPRPLPASVAAGKFGHDDDGQAIRPEADEIRAITESLADRLVELLDAIGEVAQAPARQTMQEQFTQAIKMYALEFGERPARQLEAYCRRQSSLDEDHRHVEARRGRHR